MLRLDRLFDRSRVPIPVDTCPTKRGSSQILLNVRCFPSSKCSIICETWSVVVVSIPQRYSNWSLSTSFIVSENWTPHISWRINSHFFSFGFYGSDSLHQKGTVWGRVMTTPRTSSTRISLHINPNSIIKCTWNVSNQIIDLLRGIFSSAWEHISVCF